jgi:endonuclease G
VRFALPLLVLCACGSHVDVGDPEAAPDEALMREGMMTFSSAPALARVTRPRDEVASASGNRFGRIDVITKPRRDAGEVVDAGAPEVHLDAGAPEPEPDAGAGAEVDAGTWTPPSPRGAEVSNHLALGVPDDSSVGRLDKWLLVRPQLAVSYDTANKVPNWSAWRLDASSFGAATRATSFRTDPLLGSASQARDSDYVGSGFDRGHLCPSADRTASDADNDATFFLTNVVPQTHASNAGPWLDLEDEARQLATAGKKLLIIAGPVFGTTPRQTIGTGVSVPTAMFKVVVVIDGPEFDPATLSAANATVYATIMPNAAVISGSWRQWQVTIDQVEAATGLDFLADVHPSVQSPLEARLDP